MRKLILPALLLGVALLWSGQPAIAGACWGASPTTVRVLTASWGSASRISPEASAVVTGEDSEKKDEEAERPIADKPMFIYVTDGTTDGGFDKIEKVVLDDNEVLVGMKAFRCVKMTPSDVNDDPLLAGKYRGDESRYFLFVSRDYEEVRAVGGNRMKASYVFKMMNKFARKAYKTRFRSNIKKVLKLLIEFDKIHNSMQVLADKEKRLGSDASPYELREIEEEKKELEAEQKKALEEKEKLLTFEPRKLRA